MALRDTIEGARKEASPFAFGSSKEEEQSTSRSTRKASAASAKPSRAAASSVRVQDGKPATKEEQKAKKERDRQQRDARAYATQILTEQDPDLKRTERVWWIILGTGFVLTVAALILYYVFPDQAQTPNSPVAIASIIALVLAYASIIAAFVYDWRKRRPRRKAIEAKVDGMTEKRMLALIAKHNEEVAAAKAAKKAAREARKSAK